MIKRTIVKSLTVAAMTLAVLQSSSCVSARVGPTVVSYNLAVEHAQNDMLLLNIVRAAKWKPMYLTDVSKITGSIRRDLTATLTIPFGEVNGGTAANYSGSSGATYSVSPTFDVNVLNTQDFMKGFLQPVSPALFAYFWDQGWPHELLLHLFVLEVDDGDKTYLNHPRFDTDNSDLKDFSQWVTEFVSREPHFASCEPNAANIGPPLSNESVANVTALLAIAKEAGVSLENVAGSTAPPQYQIKRAERELRIEFGLPSNNGSILPCEAGGKRGLAELAGVQIFALDLSRKSQKITLHLRSPQDVLYYLGQIVRLETHSQKVPEFAFARGGHLYEMVPIFVAFPPNRADALGHRYPAFERAAVAVTDAEGDHYIIPEGPWPPKTFDTLTAASPSEIPKDRYLGELTASPGMSVDILSIVTQLIALHKSAKDFPSTGLVRAIGQ